MNDFRLLINGHLVPGAATMDIINPATGAVIAKSPRADGAQLDAAVSAAKAAFPAWSALPIAARRNAIKAIADGLLSRLEELAQLLTSEQGRPIAQARDEIGGCAYLLQALAALETSNKVLKESDTEKVYLHRTPLGVVAAIMPWNFPLSVLTLKIAPALVTGNTVVAKPAPTTPLASLRFAEICAEHLPPGVFNMITDQNDLGDRLTSHPDVAKVSFTGSTATGKKVMQSAAMGVKRLTLELGGNDPAIVLDDVDVREVAPKLFAGAMLNSGQVCMAIKRVYVHDSQYDEMCAELARLADESVVGNGIEPGVQFGPLQNRRQFERVRELIADSRRHGKIIAGGEPGEGPGFFIRPTIVRDITDSARLVREEQFGPVLPVLRYSDLDDAIARANATEFGLAATVWSKDTERAFQVAAKIDSGVVWVNQHMNVHIDCSVSGSKQSGLGIELGVEGLQEFMQQHVVYVAK
jgi:acyl-CoA reductase-like NAD-dependent aldehyde dehydrogenase